MTSGYLAMLRLLDRQKAIDTHSPAARVLEQRDINANAFALALLDSRREEQIRLLIGRAKLRVEGQLASQGDHAEPELVQLQHELTAFLTGPQQPSAE